MGYPNQPGQYPPPAQQYIPYPPQQQTPAPYAQPDPWAQQNQQPQAAPAAPQYANQGQQMAANNGLADPFANAGVGARTGGFRTGPNGHPIVNATLRCLGSGRIVIIVPKQLRRQVANPHPEAAAKKPFRDELTADIIVCTGEPFMFGGNSKEIPDSLGPISVPCVIPDAFITNDGVIEKVPEERIGKGIVVAHLVMTRTSNNNPVWNANEVPVADYDKYGCRQAYAAYCAEQLPKAEGEQPLKQVTRAAPAPLPPAVQPQQAQQPMPQWPPMQPGQNMAPMQQAPQYLPQPVAPQPAAGDWTLTDPRAQQALSPGGPLVGYAQVWATFQAGQREQILGQLGISNQQPAMAGAQAPVGAPQGVYAGPPGY